MFNSSKYTKCYYSIIDQALSRSAVTTYTEKHHIIPKCLGGSNKKENLVCLTAREHFICHLLLPRMVDDGKFKAKMWYAAWCLMAMSGSSGNRVFKYGSRSFATIREHRSKHVVNMRTGRKHTEETKKIIGEKSKNKIYTEEYRKKLSVAGSLRRDSEEVKQRKSDAAKKRWAVVSDRDRKKHTIAATNSRRKT